jgi:hypothetical protein
MEKDGIFVCGSGDAVFAGGKHLAHGTLGYVTEVFLSGCPLASRAFALVWLSSPSHFSTLRNGDDKRS